MKLFHTILIAFSLCVAAQADPQPNIIVILVDDMGFSDIASYGGEIPTPNLDALANKGVRFSQFYNSGRCCPTRAAILTGLYSHQAGIGHMTANRNLPGYQGRLNAQCVTLAEVLKSAGYFTAMTGKWHVGFEQGCTPSTRGFDRSLNLPAGAVHFSNQTAGKADQPLYLDGRELSRDDPQLNPPWYGTDLWTEQGIKYLDEAQLAQKPFFLYLAHVAPHFPCMAPEKTIAKYRGKFMKGWDVLRKERYDRQIESGLIDASWPLAPRPEKVPAWKSLSDEKKKQYDDMMAVYAAMIDEVDKNLGVLVAALKERKQLDNTLILFLSDNGGNFESGVNGRYVGDHPGDAHSSVYIGECWAYLNNTPFRKYKHYNHEGGIATPLIAHWPNGFKPRTGSKDWITTPTHIIDIMATCVDLSGASYPTRFNDHSITPMQGQSLRPLLTGKGDLAPRKLFWEHEGNAAVRVGDQKLVRIGATGKWELYDLAADRTELNNLARKKPEAATQLAVQWESWAKEALVYPAPEKKKRKKKK